MDVEDWNNATDEADGYYSEQEDDYDRLVSLRDALRSTAP